jgi:sugar lactone lactonase YvrE
VRRVPVLLALVVAAVAAAGSSAAVPRPATPTVTGPSETENRAPVFRFRSRGAVRFLCAFDSTALRRCAARYSRRLTVGRHVLRVQGIGRTGLRSRVRAHVVAVVAPLLQFNFPGQIAVEPNGSLLVAESGGRLARIEAGAGTIATATAVPRPFGVVTAPGVIYFSDANAVRRIDTSGVVSTAAEFASDVGPLALAANGDLYVMTAARVYRLAGGQPPAEPFAGSGVEGDSGDGGPALAAQIRAPHGLAVAPDGALLISDTGNNRLRRVDPATRVITSLGNVVRPYGVAVGPDLLVYVASVDEDRVLRVDGSGAITPFAVGLESASSLAFDAAGTLFVTEGNTATARVWRVARDGTSAPLRRAAPLSRVLGSGAAPRISLVSVTEAARAASPLAVTLRIRGSAGRVTVSASSAHGTRTAAVRRSGTLGRARLLLPLPGDWRLSARIGNRTYALGIVDVRSAGADLVDPFRVSVAPDGSVVIPNGRGNNVLRLRAGRLEVLAAMEFPIDATVGPGGEVYVAATNRIQRIGGDGAVTTVAGTGVQGYSGDGGPATAAQLDFPTGVAVGPDGDLFISEVRGRIRRVDVATGLISTYAGLGHDVSSGDGGPALAAEIDRPHGLTVAADGAVYVADTYGGRIRRIDPTTHTITSVVSGLTTTLPVHVAVAPDGSLLVVEAQGAVVSRIAPSGARTPLIGTGVRGSTGDGGAASRARIEEPAGAAVAADGTIYVADIDARRVRRVDPGGRITTIAH